MSDQGAWSGSNTATLRCLKDSIASHTGIGLDDIETASSMISRALFSALSTLFSK